MFQTRKRKVAVFQEGYRAHHHCLTSPEGHGFCHPLVKHLWKSSCENIFHGPYIPMSDDLPVSAVTPLNKTFHRRTLFNNKNVSHSVFSLEDHTECLLSLGLPRQQVSRHKTLHVQARLSVYRVVIPLNRVQRTVALAKTPECVHSVTK